MMPIPGSVIRVNFPHGTIGAYGGCWPSASRYAAWESSGSDLFSGRRPRVYRDLLAEQTRKAGVEVWAYCFTPNHVHLILTPRRADGLGLAVGEAHRRCTNFINARGRWTGHLFQSLSFWEAQSISPFPAAPGLSLARSRLGWNLWTRGDESSANRTALRYSSYKNSLSLHHPADEYSGGDAYRNSRSDAYRKCRYHCLDGVPLQALDCVIHELFGSVAALFCDATRRS